VSNVHVHAGGLEDRNMEILETAEVQVEVESLEPGVMGCRPDAACSVPGQAAAC
jgi:hypothetical protein